ncbi:hypothetical protein H4S14_000776 [Agrobacterium vitis]|nr:hypothetical protein [Agrobacterium vitis]MBE1437049.1 hypothetical protein [Agrobacterium vitis]
MSDNLKPVSDEYLQKEHRLRPGERLHRLVARLADTYYDDLDEQRIEELERKVDEWRFTHADGKRFPNRPTRASA